MTAEEGAMTPTEFEEEMRKIWERWGTEEAHRQADELLCRVLAELGYDKGVEIFRKAAKWYA